MIDWLRGLIVTLQIMIFDRDLYKALRDWRDFDEADFEEVGEPE